MKTQLLYKAVFMLLLIPTMVLGSNGLNGKHTKEKTIKKEFTVNSNANLKVNNSYGNINIVTYSGNKTYIEVTVKTNSNDEDKAQKKLDEITVEFNSSSEYVSAKTIFDKNKSDSWWSWGKNNNVNMEINYVIKLPITNSVDLSNDYGSINLDKLEGRANINCDYGKITTKELMADNNYLSFDYTQNSYFEYIKSGKINADYSGFIVSKAKNLEISADYTKSVVKIAENVSYNCDYGSITVENVNNVTGNGDYLTTLIGDVYKNIDIKADYGSIKIERMNSNAGNVNIESDYVGITIGFDASYNFKFDLDLEYASLRDSEGFQFTKKRIESTDKYYQGYYGNSSTSNLIRIKSNYGSVSFKRN
ncbi:hypothetical protein GCM10011531_00170 [Aquaticitalea lipolytica]|jgi:hypothetical protein|uniref:Adhesin n=1 Tax=Aquaticitalea lipolytica TaxID=1247562 RepID=A0A8J2TIT9_9FLAO|nr:hypothetical protein [Aquaticitalea lipolytica]GFZ75772.1 hypothetical protein GCM10011531_00170 [Aquaticitalea lipolytica]